MMKINLLGQDTRELKIAAASTAPARQVLVFIVSLAVSISTVGFVYFYWSHQIAHQQAVLAHEQIRQKELATVRAQNQEYQGQLKTLEERVQTIQKLQTRRQGPVELMESLGKTVNQTKGLYLLQVTPDGNLLHIRGEAQKVQAIARFINALMNSSRFGDIKLKQYYQDNQKGQTNFRFNLDCSYIQPGPDESAGVKKASFTASPVSGRQGGRNHGPEF